MRDFGRNTYEFYKEYFISIHIFGHPIYLSLHHHLWLMPCSSRCRFACPYCRLAYPYWRRHFG